MDIMKLTRELGRALQQDQTYINMSVGSSSATRTKLCRTPSANST